MINFIHPIKDIHNGMLKDVPNKSPLKKFPSFSPTILNTPLGLVFLWIIIIESAFFVHETFEAITLQFNP